MQQLAFAQIQLSNLKAKAIGTYGEIVAASLFEKSGYEVATTGRGTKRGDLRVIDENTGQFWDIEVKTARKGKRGYQFCLRRDGGMTDCSHANYVLLLAIVPNSGRAVPFLIPVSELGTKKLIGFRTHPDIYSGKYARFRCNSLLQLEL